MPKEGNVEFVTVPRQRRGDASAVNAVPPPRSTFKSLFGAPQNPGEDREITKKLKSVFGVRVRRSVYLDVDPGQTSDKTARSDEWIPIVEKIGPERGSAGHVVWFIIVLILAAVALACIGSALAVSIRRRRATIDEEPKCFYAPYAHTSCNATCPHGAANGSLAKGHINVIYRLHSTDTARSHCECPLFRNVEDPLITKFKDSVYNVPCYTMCNM